MEGAVSGFEHGAHIGEIVDADAGREAPLAAFARSGTESQRRDLGIGVLVDEERQRFEILRHLRRHAHGQRHNRRVLGRAGDLEHDHAVLCRDRAIAEGLLSDCGPNVLVGIRHWRKEKEPGERGSAARIGEALDWQGHGTVLMAIVGAHYITPTPALRRPQ